MHDFGKRDDPEGALSKYIAGKDDLHTGWTPKADVAGPTVGCLCNAFLEAKDQAGEAGELTRQLFTANDILFQDYRRGEQAVEAWAWQKTEELVDRSASPWDREPRRLSHQGKRKVLQHEVL